MIKSLTIQEAIEYIENSANAVKAKNGKFVSADKLGRYNYLCENRELLKKNVSYDLDKDIKDMELVEVKGHYILPKFAKEYPDLLDLRETQKKRETALKEAEEYFKNKKNSQKDINEPKAEKKEELKDQQDQPNELSIEEKFNLAKEKLEQAKLNGTFEELSKALKEFNAVTEEYEKYKNANGLDGQSKDASEEEIKAQVKPAEDAEYDIGPVVPAGDAENDIGPVVPVGDAENTSDITIPSVVIPEQDTASLNITAPIVETDTSLSSVDAPEDLYDYLYDKQADIKSEPKPETEKTDKQEKKTIIGKIKVKARKVYTWASEAKRKASLIKGRLIGRFSKYGDAAFIEICNNLGLAYECSDTEGYDAGQEKLQDVKDQVSASYPDSISEEEYDALSEEVVKADQRISNKKSSRRF